MLSLMLCWSRLYRKNNNGKIADFKTEMGSITLLFACKETRVWVQVLLVDTKNPIFNEIAIKYLHSEQEKV